MNCFGRHITKSKINQKIVQIISSIWPFYCHERNFKKTAGGSGDGEIEKARKNQKRNTNLWELVKKTGGTERRKKQTRTKQNKQKAKNSILTHIKKNEQSKKRKT